MARTPMDWMQTPSSTAHNMYRWQRKRQECHCCGGRLCARQFADYRCKIFNNSYFYYRTQTIQVVAFHVVAFQVVRF
jgi:hypothetical protein